MILNSKNTYSEKELVEGCVRNDRTYQETLYRRFYPTMIGMCLRYTQDRNLAMEIVNTGFLRVFKKLHTFKFAGSLEGWIRKVVYHSLADHFKKKSSNVHFLEIEKGDKPRANHILEGLYAEDILKTIDRLPDATRRVFLLYAIEGYKHHEIGEQLGISVGTSKWHLSEARKKLKTFLTEDGIIAKNG
ncbi:MAG: RNA polymerase sigma factor [Bacteroidota bacterium]